MADTDERTPFQVDRDRAERTGKWPEGWGPFHRHFASDAIHRDGGPECGQPGTPRRVYVFDPDALEAHEAAVTKWAAAWLAATGIRTMSTETPQAACADTEHDRMWYRRYRDVQAVLDEALGAEEKDGSGEGIAGDVALLAAQRDAARAEAATLAARLRDLTK